ncbi:hypothetical protein KM043_013183 [Ampulex compressa]|nr:hypothetical protein KM043_013183 [Ampulex compressa]
MCYMRISENAARPSRTSTSGVACSYLKKTRTVNLGREQTRVSRGERGTYMSREYGLWLPTDQRGALLPRTESRGGERANYLSFGDVYERLSSYLPGSPLSSGTVEDDRHD